MVDTCAFGTERKMSHGTQGYHNAGLCYLANKSTKEVLINNG